MRRSPIWAAVGFLLLCIVTNANARRHLAKHAKIRTGSKRASPPSPPAFTPEGAMSDITQKKLLAEMNKYRLMHDSAPLGVCLACSLKASAWVKEIAKTGNIRSDPKDRYGMTSFKIKDDKVIAKGADYMGTLIAATWYNQIKSYDFIKNEFKGAAADFSQLVWSKTEMAGFGSTKAADGTYYVIAYYTPAGNNETQSFYENVNRVTGAGDNECQYKCPEGWELANCACYRLYKDLTAWADAVDRCNVLKSSLVSVEDAGEHQTVRGLITKNAVGASWIGLSDYANKGTYAFVDGAPYVYSSWTYDSYNKVAMQPNEIRGKCALENSTQGWEYRLCTEKRPFICKMRPNGVLSFSLDFYFPGSTYTSDLANPAAVRYATLKENIEKALNESFRSEIWYLGHTFYQFMPRENKEVAASTLLRFAPDARAPVDPLTKLREYLRASDILKILSVRLVPGSNRVSTPAVAQGTCPGMCSADCFPECNPTCCSIQQIGFGVSLPLTMDEPAPPPPPPPMAYAYPQPQAYAPAPQAACPQMPSCPQQCAPACQPSCCSQSAVRSIFAGKRDQAPRGKSHHAAKKHAAKHHK